MFDLAVMKELVEGAHRKHGEQNPSSDPLTNDDAVEVEVQSADESEWAAAASSGLHCCISRTSGSYPADLVTIQCGCCGVALVFPMV